MLSESTIRRLNALGEISKAGKRINGLFRLMESPTLWEQAYVNIYSNKGAMTKGVDGATLDGFSDERAVNIIKLLKEDRYQFKPSRRVYIPKANGKMRPLGIPSADDKLVQEVMRIILERIYEPVFSDRSHGFRPAKSCHTALKSIKMGWTGIKWIIDMDIQGFFDNIDHGIMVRLLEKRIDDKQFIKLIRAMLKAGYLDDWKFHGTYSGAPQGGIISPILANIYLHELDEFIESLREKYHSGKRRLRNPEYRQYEYKLGKLRKDYDECNTEGATDELRLIRRQFQYYDGLRKQLPAFDPYDRNFRRLTYCRYADDFVIGIIGSKEDGLRIMEEVKTFLQDDLKLSISVEKSGIRHATEVTRFLGYDLSMYSGERIVRTTRAGRYTTVLSISEKIELSIPQDKLLKFCHGKGYGNYDRFTMTPRSNLINLSDAEIITIYNAEMRGLANYYVLATGAHKTLNKLHAIWQGSLIKTLAHKHRTHVSRVIKTLKTAPGVYALTDVHKGKPRTHKLFSLKELPSYPLVYPAVDSVPNTQRQQAIYSELARRMQAQHCELCGRRDGYFEVHLIAQLKDVLGGSELWQQLMAKRRRKTLVLCVECHGQLHSGTLPAWKHPKIK